MRKGGGRNNSNGRGHKCNIQSQICGKQGHVAHTFFQLIDLISRKGRYNQT